MSAPRCTHLLRPPGHDRCARCRWWDDYVVGWRALGQGVAAEPLVRKKALAAACRRRFSTFVREAFRVVRPGRALVWTWYLEALCDHVQWMLEEWRKSKRVRDYAAPAAHRNLLVSVPPGSGKTLIISVLAPAWMWIDSPEWTCLCLSVNPMVARDSAVDCRSLVTSQWYRDNFVVGVAAGEGRAAEVNAAARQSGVVVGEIYAQGEVPRASATSFDEWADMVARHPAKTTEMWEISEDRNTMGKFVTTRGGFRASQGMTAQVVGARADCLLVDDPNDPSCTSDAYVQTYTKYDSVLYHRVNDLATAVRIVIQQRLDPADLTGFILERYPDGQSHLCLPLLHEVDRRCRTSMPVAADNRLWLERDGQGDAPAGTWQDPRTRADQVLSKKRWPEDEVKKLRGGGNFGAICQQDPERAEGEHFEEQKWGFWVDSTSSEEQRAEWREARPLGCSKTRPALVVPRAWGGRLECGKVWVTDDPTSGSVSKDASHVGLLVMAEWRSPQTGEQCWLVVHDMDPGPQTPSQQRETLDRAIRLAAQLTGHDRVRVLVEDKSSGKDHAEAIEKHVNTRTYDGVSVTVELHKAGSEQSKEDRAVAVLDAPQESGRLLLPDGGKCCGPLVRQFRRFPKKPNDKVDAAGQLVAHTAEGRRNWGKTFLRAMG